MGGVRFRDGAAFVDRCRNAEMGLAALAPATARFAIPGPEFYARLIFSA
jgi:hypothetical protein